MTLSLTGTAFTGTSPIIVKYFRHFSTRMELQSKPCKTCGTTFEGEDWKTLCPQCWNKRVAREHTDHRILRQVLLKIASEQNPNSTPEDIIEYAKKLETEWEKWA